MEYTVRNKTFKIDFVNNYVQEQYLELENKTNALIRDTDMEGVSELIEVNQKEANKKLNEINTLRLKYKKELIEIRRDIIKELIESNGITYDLIWWTRKTDPDDINEFMVSCVNQDVTKSKPTKKK